MLSLLFVLLFADPHLHGVVRDHETQAPVEGATIRVLGTRLGTITDKQGEFHIHDVRGDSVTLEIRMLGYVTALRRVPTFGDADVLIELHPDSLEAHEILVQGDRGKRGQGALPTQPRRVLSAEEIDATRDATFSGSLEQVPGVTTMKTGPSISKPMLRGMSGTRIVLAQAGVAQEGQQWGEEHGPEIDPFTPSTVTIMKGASGVRLGPNAMGGAIAVEPAALGGDGLKATRGELSINGFSNNWQGAGGGWIESTRLFDEDISVRANGSYRIAGDARTPEYVLGNTAFRSGSLGGLVSLGDDTLGVDVYGSYYALDLGIYQGSHIGNPTDLQRAIERGGPSREYEFDYNIDRPRQEVQHTLLSVRSHYRTSKTGKLTLKYGWQQNDRSEFDRHGRTTQNEDRPAMNLLLTTYNLDLGFDHALTDNVGGAVGVSGLRQVNDRSGAVFLVPDYLAHGLGAWAYESIALDRWSFSAGLRYDRRWLESTLRSRTDTTGTVQNKTFDGLALNVGAMFMPIDDLQFQLNLGTAWRPPQVNELYSNDVHHGVARYEIGDSTLVPERNYGVDLTTGLAVRKFELEASFYANWFDGYIFSLPDPDNPTLTIRGAFPTFRFTQTDALIAGIDLMAAYDITDVFTVYGKGSIVRGQDMERDEPLIFMPQDRLRLGTHIHLHDVLGIHEAYIDVSALGVREQDRYVPGQDLAPPPPGYMLADISAGGLINTGHLPLRFSVSVRNVFDASYRDYLSRYRYFALDPGRDVIIRFTIPFGPHQ